MVSRIGEGPPGPSIGKKPRIVFKKLARKLLKSLGCDMRRGPFDEDSELELVFELVLIYLLGTF